MQLGIDPGKKRSAIAVSPNGKDLSSVHWLPSGKTFQWGSQVALLTIEKMHIYPGIPQIDANDLIDCALEAGWWKRDIMAHQVKEPTPPDWKGQLKKPQCHYRIWEVLSKEERALFPADTEDRILKGCAGGAYKSEWHNLLDATGILFFGIGRLGRGMVKIRP